MRLRGERAAIGIKGEGDVGGKRVERGIKVDRVRLDTDIGGEG